MLAAAVVSVGALAAGAGGAVAATSSKPTVRTGSATQVRSTSARVNGTVNPNGTTTGYTFQFGRTRRYGSTTTIRNAGSGRRAVAASAQLTRLRPNTVYHYRLVAANSRRQSAVGADRTFRTARATTTRPTRTPRRTTRRPSFTG